MLFADQEVHLQKIREGTEGWIAKHLNKPVSFAITRRLMATQVTPNQITVGNFLLAVLASLLLVSNLYPIRCLAALLMQLSSILDGCDGEIARLKGLCSKTGAWLDTIFDDLTNNLFFLGIFVGLQRSGMSHGPTTFFGWETVVASIGVSAIIYHYLLTVSHTAHAAGFRLAWQKTGETGLKSAPTGFYDRCLKPLMKRDFFIFFMAVMVILDQRTPCFWVAVVATNVTFLLYFVSFWRRRRIKGMQSPH